MFFSFSKNAPQSVLYKTLPILLVIAFIVLYSCSTTRNEVHVLHTNFTDEIEQQQNLIFQFNKDLFPDSLSGNWDSTAYIEFEPKVSGSFRWNNTNELVFSPNRGFMPATEYKATLTSHLLDKTLSKYGYKIGSNKTVAFHTAPLRVTHATSVLTRGKEASNVMQQLDVAFNYETDATQAASKLKLSAYGNPVNFNVVNSGIGKTLSVQFEPVNKDDKTTDLKINFDKGISIAGSKILSQKDTSFITPVISRYVLQSTGLNAQHDGIQGTVDITFSQPVSEQELKNLISIEPKVKFDAVTTDDGISITSKEFDPKANYNITIKKSLQGEYGGVLKEDYVGRASFGTLDPYIGFINTKGMYLSTKGYRNVALNIVQVAKVQVSVIKVYENNIYQLISHGKSYGYSYGEDDENDNEYHDYQYYRTENLGDTIFQKVYDTKTLPKNNAASVLHLDFSDKLKGYDGIYVIKVASTDHKWLQDSKILSLSNIGLIVKQEQNKLYVFANSIRNATPVNGAKISFISNTNQVAATAVSDKEGMAVFDATKAGTPDFKIGMVTAKMNDEFSFVTFKQNLIETSRFDVGGRSVSSTGINAWIYAERNLYRPGETVHASVIARNEGWGLPGELPVKLRLLMPNGKEFAVRRKMLNEQGSTEAEFPIPNTALTGTYTLQAYSGNDVLLNTYNISIEDFMPDRIKVDLKLPKTEYSLGEAAASSIQADNLFGTPAVNRHYEWELNIDKAPFEPKGYKDYNFEVVKDFNFKTILRSGQTGEKGNGQETFDIPKDLAETGLLKGNITTTVFDETGRPVHRYANFNVYTQPSFIGIKQFNEYVGTHVPLHVNLIALDKSGTPQTQNATVTIIRKEWQNVIQETDGRYKYVAQWVSKQIITKDITLSGSNTQYSYTPEISGEYEIHVARAGSENYVSNSFYAYGNGDTQYSSFEVNNEGNVTIKADKESYQPGENINLLFTTPFEGRMLVTVERDKILEHYFVNTNNKSASIKLSASEAFLPNVYISATLIRPMDESDMPLTVAHGYENIKVESKQNKLPVSVTMKDHSRSKAKQTIMVKTSPDAYVTIAAVDEGILQVKNYETPDPYNYFYQKVGLGVNSYDIYPLLLPEIKASQSSTGGDGAADENQGRVNPMFVNRIKNVSFWSGIIKADSRGLVKYDIDVPQFSGDVRVMVVAYKDKAFGSFDNHMKVADPIVISTALPRFFSPGDEALMPITLSNTTNKEASVQITVQVQGAVTLPGASSQTISIQPNSEGRAVFNINAAQQIGSGKVVVTVKAMNEAFTNETEIGVRPPASLQKQYASGIINAGNSASISLNNNFLPGTFSGNLVVANTPLVQFTKNLSYLIHYPYGCVEQTTSAAFPQLYYSDLTKISTGKESNDLNPNYNVQQAILKLQSMQLPNGSLSYWPGGNYESWWGSVFATHFLLEAQRAGFEVNQTTLNRLLDYMRFRLKKKETIDYYFNGNQSRTIIAKEVIYSLYILALAHVPDISLMNYYKGNGNMLSMDEKYLLAATFALSGQGDKAKQVLPVAFSGENAETQFGGSFYSYERDKAVALNALLDIDPQNSQVPELARQLSQDLQSNPYLNTQENVWAILALGKIAHRTANASGEAQILANGKTIGSTKGAAIKIDLKDLMSQPLQVKVSGNGAYYYFQELSGITANGNIKEEDKYMRVRRGYYSREGRAITSNTFKQNDLIVVRITIEAQYRGEIENVVITDMLPAGLEIENTRLNDMPNLKWVTDIKEKDEPDYMDVRDDRLNIFTTANSKPKTFYYMVRAVSPGIFKLGPIQADAMYNGAYHSYNGAGIVKVEE